MARPQVENGALCPPRKTFARTGDPNHQGLPRWTAFTSKTHPTMIFDNTCAVAYDADREELEVLASA